MRLPTFFVKIYQLENSKHFLSCRENDKKMKDFLLKVIDFCCYCSIKGLKYSLRFYFRFLIEILRSSLYSLFVEKMQLLQTFDPVHRSCLFLLASMCRVTFYRIIAPHIQFKAQNWSLAIAQLVQLLCLFKFSPCIMSWWDPDIWCWQNHHVGSDQMWWMDKTWVCFYLQLLKKWRSAPDQTKQSYQIIF